MSIKVGFISLGCPKNQVDAELMLSKIEKAGYEIVDVAYEADVVIVNTCGFIEDAKREAIDNILEMAELKNEGSIERIIVTGCLSERYQEEILKEMPEIDGVLGLGANGDIVKAIESVMQGEGYKSFPNKEDMPLGGDRLLTTPQHWAYLKIADGCSNCCTYCAIPSIRGEFRSRRMEDIVNEAKTLAAAGTKEIVVIAQDTTRYGLDLYGELKLSEILRQLDEIEGIEWIRLLYCYPDRITDELLDTVAASKHVLHYFDIPLQHANGKVLKAMNRTGDRESLTALIDKIREKMPDVILRTTMIAGFPGETETDFIELCEFIDDIQFDRLGCFAYSAEEGTPAAILPDQIDEDEKKRRADIVNEQQFDVFQYKLKQHIDTTVKCIVEGYDGYTDSYFGRTWMDAPEIDSNIYFTGRGEYNEGDIVDVSVFDINDYDLMGEIV